MKDDEIRELAKEAGLGARSTKKLVDANQKRRGEDPTKTDEQSAQGRGHGAAREHKTPAVQF